MDRSKANPESRSTGRLRLCLFLLVIAGIPSCVIAQSNTGATAQLNINVTRIISPVSPTLYGLMTEEINHSYDGGLYAEMIQNRAFHVNWEGTPPWDLVRRGNAVAGRSIDKSTGPSESLPYSMKLTVTSGPFPCQVTLYSPAASFVPATLTAFSISLWEIRNSRLFPFCSARAMGPLEIRSISDRAPECLSRAISRLET